VIANNIILIEISINIIFFLFNTKPNIPIKKGVDLELLIHIMEVERCDGLVESSDAGVGDDDVDVLEVAVPDDLNGLERHHFGRAVDGEEAELAAFRAGEVREPSPAGKVWVAVAHGCENVVVRTREIGGDEAPSDAYLRCLIGALLSEKGQKVGSYLCWRQSLRQRWSFRTSLCQMPQALEG